MNPDCLPKCHRNDVYCHSDVSHRWSCESVIQPFQELCRSSFFNSHACKLLQGARPRDAGELNQCKSVRDCSKTAHSQGRRVTAIFSIEVPELLVSPERFWLVAMVMMMAICGGVAKHQCIPALLISEPVFGGVFGYVYQAIVPLSRIGLERF